MVFFLHPRFRPRSDDWICRFEGKSWQKQPFVQLLAAQQARTSAVSLRRLVQLQAGDVIPLDWQEDLEVCVEDMPVFRGRLGTANGNHAVQITEFIRRENPTPSVIAPASSSSGRASAS